MCPPAREVRLNRSIDKLIKSVPSSTKSVPLEKFGMRKDRETKDDDRYIIFYSFEDEETEGRD